MITTRIRPTIRPGGPVAGEFPEGRILTYTEAMDEVRSGRVAYDSVEPVTMPGGETWYRVVA